MRLKLAIGCVCVAALCGVCLASTPKELPDVRIGLCGTISQIDDAKAAGFDYMELRVSEVAALSDADFDQLQTKLKTVGLPVPDAYLFVPGNIKLTGPTIDKDQQMTYVRMSLDRMAKLGTRTVVLGSGPARAYPDGFPKEQAYDQFKDFCKRLGPEARSRNITIAIEPLRPEESNLINSLAEGLTLIKDVNDPNIQLNLDYYQFEMVKEDPGDILLAGDHIRHVHMANPKGRVFPLRKTEYDYKPLFDNLAKIGYDREMSIEGTATDFAKLAPTSIAFLRMAVEHKLPGK